MDMRIPPLRIKILLGSNPLQSRILVRTLATNKACHVEVPGRQSFPKSDCGQSPF